MSANAAPQPLALPEFAPYTALTRRYVELKDRPSVDRLRAAREVTGDELASEFLQSVEAFSGFVTDHAFFPNEASRDVGKNAKSWLRTYGWAMSMRNTRPAVTVEGSASELDFTYVSREIIPTRTKPAVAFQPCGGLKSAPASGMHKVSVDLILANASTGRPVVAELKIASDKDPYTGLVQALAAAAQMVSPEQRARLDRLAESSAGTQLLCSFEQDPRIDVYVLLADFPERGRDRFEQLKRAFEVAAELEGHSGMREYVGRIRVLSAQRRGFKDSSTPGTVQASTRLPKRQ